LVIDTRNENLTVRSDQSAHNSEKISHGFVDSASKDTRVQISARSLDAKVEVRYSAKTISQAGLGGTEPVVIRNADSINIGKVLLGLKQDKVIKTLRARLLHTFKAHLQVDGKFETQVLMGLDNIEPSKNRALVVCASTTEKTAFVILNKCERIGVPTVFLQSLITHT
jgi:hypothetical protein